MFRTARWPLLVLGGWAIAGLIGGGPTIIRLLYDSRYWEAGWMLQIVASGLWFGIVLSGTYGAVVLAVGRSDWNASMSFSKVFGMVAFIPLGYWLGGFPGALGGLAMSEFVRYCIAVYGAAGLGFDERRERPGVHHPSCHLCARRLVRRGWLAELGITHVVIHAFVVFVVVTAFWASPFINLIARVRRERSFFGNAGGLSNASGV